VSVLASRSHGHDCHIRSGTFTYIQRLLKFLFLTMIYLHLFEYLSFSSSILRSPKNVKFHYRSLSPSVFLSGQASSALHRLGRTVLSRAFELRAGPGLKTLGWIYRHFWPGVQGVSWWLGSCSSWTECKQNILFKLFSAAFTKKLSQGHNINHIQLSHCTPAIAVFHQSSKLGLMQANARLFESCAGRPGHLEHLTPHAMVIS